MTIGFSEWLSESIRRVQDEPLLGTVKSLYYVYVGCWYSLSNRVRFGQNILDDDWDALIILDSCRVDALREVAPEYDFLTTVESRRSLGSTSLEWMAKTFSTRYAERLAETSYVCGNPYTDLVFSNGGVPPSGRAVPFAPTDYDVVDREGFYRLDGLYEYAYDETLRTVPPEIITDRAIAVGREDDTQLLIHYMQPHAPFINADKTSSKFPWNNLKDGTDSHQEVWEMYLQTLRWALDEVAVLLSNLDAEKVVITADHGEAFGEFGTYGHVSGHPHPVLRRVPWVETEATDSGEYKPSVEPSDPDNPHHDTEDLLSDLGYL